jgi:hypothetical protein
VASILLAVVQMIVINLQDRRFLAQNPWIQGVPNKIHPTTLFSEPSCWFK